MWQLKNKIFGCWHLRRYNEPKSLAQGCSTSPYFYWWRTRCKKCGAFLKHHKEIIGMDKPEHVTVKK